MLNSFQGFLARPFSADMDWKRWAAFILFVMVLLVVWSMVLKRLEAV